MILVGHITTVAFLPCFFSKVLHQLGLREASEISHVLHFQSFNYRSPHLTPQVPTEQEEQRHHLLLLCFYWSEALDSHLANGQRVEKLRHRFQRQDGLSVGFVQTAGELSQDLKKKTNLKLLLLILQKKKDLALPCCEIFPRSNGNPFVSPLQPSSPQQ